MLKFVIVKLKFVIVNCVLNFHNFSQPVHDLVTCHS